ncbi:hypothetical protein EIN_083990 [Entamoeba invadens IP1]|uniref:hypothetical protein n=1 Tax=Entamoeba invadens IP1 TaxID=370355 RepID=UPI0002C3D7AB|nr:hypothetical protein EIN_083990 [Entamoeba invadens IP1]ELP85247.1 hypothetical protein EIN_083990 [Entamoeba invadens IP1]|eukprot:XP_004184593.1 hypothetical protein EIN_083990 [Entamoeba invadens IP1]
MTDKELDSLTEKLLEEEDKHHPEHRLSNTAKRTSASEKKDTKEEEKKRKKETINFIKSCQNPSDLFPYFRSEFVFYAISRYVSMNDSSKDGKVINDIWKNNPKGIPMILDHALSLGGENAVTTISHFCCCSLLIPPEVRDSCFCKIAEYLRKNPAYIADLRRFGEFNKALSDLVEHPKESDCFFVSCGAIVRCDITLLSEYAEFTELVKSVIETPTKGKLVFLMMLLKTPKGVEVLLDILKDVGSIGSKIKKEEGVDKAIEIFVKEYEKAKTSYDKLKEEKKIEQEEDSKRLEKEVIEKEFERINKPKTSEEVKNSDECLIV